MPGNDLALLKAVAYEAGHIAARFWRKSPKVWHKPDHQGPVTEADLEIDAMLYRTLTSARPDYGWLSEETEDDETRLAARRIFVVDPLDGTRAFVEGERTFAHSLAVVEDGQVLAAVVLLPLRNKLYAAALGEGASLNGTPVHCGTRDTLEGAHVLLASPALDEKHWRGAVPALQRHLRPSLAYRLCLVAEGRFDAMLTIRDTWDWDTAAGALIVTEAGGRISDRAGQPLLFNTPRPVSRGVVAGAPSIHGEIVARLQP